MATPDEPQADLAELDLEADRRADVLRRPRCSSRLGGRGEGRAAGGVGDVLERLAVDVDRGPSHRARSGRRSMIRRRRCRRRWWDRARPGAWPPRRPTASGRPTVVSPSDISTMPGRRRLVRRRRPSGRSLMASRLAKIASPMAVPSASSRSSMAPGTAPWSVVGGTRTLAVPVNATRPTLIVGGTMSRNDVGRLLGRLEAVGRDVGRPPSTATCRWPGRPWPAPAGTCSLAGRAGRRRRPAAPAPSSEGGGGDVAAPARALGGDDVEQGEVGEAHGVAAGAGTCRTT